MVAMLHRHGLRCNIINCLKFLAPTKYPAVGSLRSPALLTRRSGYALLGLLWLLVIGWREPTVLAWGFRSLPFLFGVGLGASALYLLPGLAVLRLLWCGTPLAGSERIALASGISIGLPPLLFQIAHLIYLPWNRWTTLGYLAIALVIVAWPIRGRSLQITLTALRPSLYGLLLTGLTALGLLIRLYLVRDLAVGQWGDSYQHTMMAQLLVDNQGLFTSWEPYAPLTTFTYHYGFHSNVALFHWLTGMQVPLSMVYVGQIMNAATIPGAYLLTHRWSGSARAGIWAAALTGFLSLQPFFYVNWGRYTQLAGQVVLPVVLVCWLAALERPRLDRRMLALAGIVTACLILTHYIVTIIAAVFVVAYLLMLALRRPVPRFWGQLIAGASVISLTAVVLALPSLLNTLAGHLSRNVQGFVTKDIGVARIAEYATLLPLTPTYIYPSILGVAGIGVLLALIRRHWQMLLFAVWTLLLLGLVVPHVVGLPGSGIIPFFTAAIALYLTVIPLAAYVAGVTWDTLSTRFARYGSLLAVVGLMGVTGLSAAWQPRTIDPFFQLVTPADARAMEWIKQATPADALFLVNMFPAYGDNLMAGDDGGLWIPLLTGRRSTLPPLTYGSERGPTDDYAYQINNVVWYLQQHPLPSDLGIQFYRAAGIQYIYSGPHVERTDYRVDIAALRNSAAFEAVYDQDGVVIFKLKAAP